MYDPTNVQAATQSNVGVPNFLIGALLGAGVALLLAPAPGKETRQRLGETARRWRDGAQHTLDRTRENLAARS